MRIFLGGVAEMRAYMLLKIFDKNVWHGAKNVRHGAENVRLGARNVQHGAKNVR